EALGDGAEWARRVGDQRQRAVLGMRAPAELVGGARDVGAAFLPHACPADLPGAVEGVEDRVRRWVHAARAGTGVARVEHVPRAGGVPPEPRVVRLVTRDI